MLVIPFSLGLVMPNKVYHPDQGLILVSVLIGALTCKIVSPKVPGKSGTFLQSYQSFIFYLFSQLYEVTALISSRFKCYVKLNRSQKVEWNNRYRFHSVLQVLLKKILGRISVMSFSGLFQQFMLSQFLLCPSTFSGHQIFSKMRSLMI